MAEEKKKKKDPVLEMIKELRTGKEANQLKALQKLKKDGDNRAIEELVFQLANSKSEKVLQTVETILNELKDSASVIPLIAAIENEEYLPIREKLIAVFWNSSIDGGDHLDLFVRIALTGSYMEAFECLTVIDNLEGPLDESMINEALLDINEWAEDNKGHEKYDILKQLYESLQRHNQFV